MATITGAPPALSGDLTLFHTTDPFLANAPLLLFHGPASSVGAASSRVQLHIFTIAGHASYSRLAISPNSPFYTAVSNLPREEQGDEICRSIAFGLRKYFEELSNTVKSALSTHVKSSTPQMLWGDNHVAILASRLKRVENRKAVAEDIVRCFAEQRLSWLDVDVVLPPGSIKDLPLRSSSDSEELSEHKLSEQRYGKYAPLVSMFGDIAFLPTSKMKRAPSKVSSIGRSASFMRQQRENARKEVLELVSTESSYVSRLEELMSIRNGLPERPDTTGAQLHDVFPVVLDSIIAANKSLLEALQEIQLATIDSSNDELTSMTTEQPTAQQIRQDLLADNQGIGAVAKCLVEKLPAFHDSYGSYMRDHVAASLLLRSLTRGTDANAQTTIQEVGEQKLTSLLIEPVQRLPRYGLYIDSISKQLPARHPALKNLLKARDIVSNICEQSDDIAPGESISQRLATRVKHWPDDVNIRGRLITAVDTVELCAPYSLENVVQKSVLLLFTDGVVMLGKNDEQTISARTLMTELEAVAMRSSTVDNLSFIEFTPLANIELAESHEGQSIQLTLLGLDGRAAAILTLLLEGSYESKASRLMEEIAKARVEAHFSEAEREDCKWEARATNDNPDQLRLFSAVHEDSRHEFVAHRQDSAAIRIFIDIDKHSQKVRAGQQGTHTVITISPLRDGNYRLSIDSVDGQGGSEQIPAVELSLTLRRKLGLVLALRASPERAALTSICIDRYSEILRSIHLDLGVKEEAVAVAPVPKTSRQNTLRPLSPVKMLSSFLSSTGPEDRPRNTLRKEPSGSSILSAAAAFSMLPASKTGSSLSKPPSREGRPVSRDQSRPISMISTRSLEKEFDSLRKLEESLSAYLLALKARKGNIVGRSLKMRASADELVINELYNALLEHPQAMDAAAQAPVDVLFAAFEKFLHVAWVEQHGHVMPRAVLQDIQTKAETLFPTDFDEQCRGVLRSLPAHNQRAFKSIITLLNDLLDGTGNDADRGALTAAFAELLVTEGNPHDFVSLIDRFVDDADTYFGEPLPEEQTVAGHGHKRSRSVNTGSLTSNTSSLRRKFGLGLSRENSKSEHEKSSVWRTLSKSRTREQSPADSLSRRTLPRSQPTESDSRANSRPVSQDGPAVRKHNSSETLQVPTIMPSILPGLTTIGEHPSFIPTGPPRKKRRSSLSDLKMLETPFVTPQRPVRSPPSRQVTERSLPTSPSTPSSKGGSLRIPSPVRPSQRPPLPAAFRKENTTPAVIEQAIHSLATIEVQSPQSPPRYRQTSSIPALSKGLSSPAKLSVVATTKPPVTPVRGGLTERNDLGNVVRKPTLDDKSSPTKLNSGSPTKKLRVQSPQKIRERLQVEQAAIVAAHSNLQDELSKISDELTLTPGRLVPGRSSISRGTGGDLTAKVLKMETTMTEQFSKLGSTLQGIQADLTSSLNVSEAKCKKLDELYRESNAENEALYARFNEELARVSRAVRGGTGVQELKDRLKAQEDEIARLKKDNVRLKREVVGLRAQLKE